jgi:hypothetical protein
MKRNPHPRKEERIHCFFARPPLIPFKTLTFATNSKNAQRDKGDIVSGMAYHPWESFTDVPWGH